MEQEKQQNNRLNKSLIEIDEHGPFGSRETNEAEDDPPMTGAFVQTDGTPMKTRSRMDGQATTTATTATSGFRSGFSIFDRYTDFGGIASSRSTRRTEQNGEDDDDDDGSEIELDFSSTKEPGSTVLVHSTKNLLQQLYQPMDHIEPRPFPDRQLFVYVVADPTDMRLELATLRLSVWPELQRSCDSRGFSLQVVDRSVETDFNPPIDPELEIRQQTNELENYLAHRSYANEFLDCLVSDWSRFLNTFFEGAL
ncbi:unnamed protein product [Echinostoma caproni]|uniref:Uncharacterized protein n=1 Tax=Echinostoma caproni TaxID=27848 RepID=A0A183AE70_9TREM|nr:unnamed protein product [Echinostoma caproni]